MDDPEIKKCTVRKDRSGRSKRKTTGRSTGMKVDDPKTSKGSIDVGDGNW